MMLSIIVPCYNEEAVLPETARRLAALLGELVSREKLSGDSHVVFVDDGSRDQTWSIIESLARYAPVYRGLKLSRNRGHQNALLAGLQHAQGDITISVDADLQDDLSAIEAMVDAHAAGADIVYGVRKRRDRDSFFKRASAEAYYRLLARFGVEVVFNHADYRLMSRRALAALAQFGESNLFLRGIIPQLGFPSAIVYYDRAERFAGESKYPLRKMLAFAWQGISSFSAAPLHLVTGLGLLVSLGSMGFSAWALWVWLFTEHAVPGWTSTVVPLVFLGGVQLLSIGILGEYVAKIYSETKRRPAYFLEKQIGFSQAFKDTDKPS
ncbi:MAG: glycosyltransferase family 2 protein [Uliginosibacterium sp.]|nr:glycosyltransferase family 2 protein [Uliginosibacterium sp.]